VRLWRDWTRQSPRGRTLLCRNCLNPSTCINFIPSGIAIQEIVGTLEELVYEYKTAPKKLVAQKKKKKGQAAAAVPADV